MKKTEIVLQPGQWITVGDVRVTITKVRRDKIGRLDRVQLGFETNGHEVLLAERSSLFDRHAQK
jgi:hypothetical protein